jgi:hypothetical protein
MLAAMRLSAADRKITLEQMRVTLRQHLPGPRGELAYEYVELALARLPQPTPERIASAKLRETAPTVTM